MFNIDRYGCLRRLRERDVDGMLEWMHDQEISGRFQLDFSSMSANDAEKFVRESVSGDSIHLAISGRDDEYLGTISLKHIDPENGNAEYAIVTRRKVHGTGVAEVATRDILSLAFEKIGLHRVYLNVKKSNERAVSFYKKVGFLQEGIARDAIKEGDEYDDLLWYAMLSTDRNEHGCR